MSQQKRQRVFSKELKTGDRVSIIRTRHGWYDGALFGKVIEVTDRTCVVLDDNGKKHEIPHPRDIRKRSF